MLHAFTLQTCGCTHTFPTQNASSMRLNAKRRYETRRLGDSFDRIGRAEDEPAMPWKTWEGKGMKGHIEGMCGGSCGVEHVLQLAQK